MSKKLLIVIIVLLLIGVAGYAYGYFIVRNAIFKSVQTMQVTDFKLLSFSLLPPQATVELTFTIRNPTSVNLEIHDIYLEIYIDNFYVGDITAKNKILLAHGKTTLKGTYKLTPQLVIHLGTSKKINLHIQGYIDASGKFLFLKIPYHYEVNVQQVVEG